MCFGVLEEGRYRIGTRNAVIELVVHIRDIDHLDDKGAARRASAIVRPCLGCRYKFRRRVREYDDVCRVRRRGKGRWTIERNRRRLQQRRFCSAIYRRPNSTVAVSK